MKLASLKKPKEEAKKDAKNEGAAPITDKTSYFPYWTRMTISGEKVLSATGLAGVKAGDVLKLEARVRVKEVVTVDVDDKKEGDFDRARIEIQFEQMGVENADEDEAAEGFREGEDKE